MLNPIGAVSSEVVRDINSRLVLNLIRTRQPLSRADLARLSGLQRSTISLIVEQLVQVNWVLEGPTARLPRGRRPTSLRLNEDRFLIGIDIRPTQITLALADINGKFLAQQVMKTPSTPEAAVEGMLEHMQPFFQGCEKKIEGIGISLPGRLDTATGHLVFAPNLHSRGSGWGGFDIAGAIAKATGLPVELENAANACVLAAVWFDRSETFRNMVVVTVSEGIGTGILMNGQLIRGHHGMAGEFGHVPLDPNGPACSCGRLGCWEVFASNRAALRYYGGPEGLSFADLLGLADQGDARATDALDKMAHSLGRGMRMVAAGLAPEQIVVIGDLTRSWQRFGPVIESEIRAQALGGGVVPRLIPAHEDGLARLRGTVALVLQKHFNSPQELQAEARRLA